MIWCDFDWERSSSSPTLIECQKYIERISRAFNAAWTPELSILHQRALIVAPDPFRAPMHVLPSAMPINAAEIMQLVADVAASNNFLIGNAFMYFLADYHRKMRADHLDYASAKDRLLAATTLDDSMMGVPTNMLTRFSQDWEEFDNPVAAYNHIHGRSVKTCDCCQATEKGAKFHLCSACKVARYCSSACQKEDWKNHKPICQVWRQSKKNLASKQENLAAKPKKKK
jgi:hypothetical protein